MEPVLYELEGIYKQVAHKKLWTKKIKFNPYEDYYGVDRTLSKLPILDANKCHMYIYGDLSKDLFDLDKHVEKFEALSKCIKRLEKENVFVRYNFYTQVADGYREEKNHNVVYIYVVTNEVEKEKNLPYEIRKKLKEYCEGKGYSLKSSLDEVSDYINMDMNPEEKWILDYRKNPDNKENPITKMYEDIKNDTDKIMKSFGIKCNQPKDNPLALGLEHGKGGTYSYTLYNCKTYQILIN